MCVDQVFQLLVSIHATASYQNNASTDYKDCTDDVEDCGTDATGGRKLCTRLVGNCCGLFKVSSSVVFFCNCKCRISSLVITSRYSFLNQSVCSICESCESRNDTLCIRLILSCIINAVYPGNNTVSNCIVLVISIFNYETCTSERLLFAVLFGYSKFSIVNLEAVFSAGFTVSASDVTVAA